MHRLLNFVLRPYPYLVTQCGPFWSHVLTYFYHSSPAQMRIQTYSHVSFWIFGSRQHTCPNASLCVSNTTAMQLAESGYPCFPLQPILQCCPSCPLWPFPIEDGTSPPSASHHHVSSACFHLGPFLGCLCAVWCGHVQRVQAITSWSFSTCALCAGVYVCDCVFLRSHSREPVCLFLIIPVPSSGCPISFLYLYLFIDRQINGWMIGSLLGNLEEEASRPSCSSSASSFPPLHPVCAATGHVCPVQRLLCCVGNWCSGSLHPAVRKSFLLISLRTYGLLFLFTLMFQLLAPCLGSLLSVFLSSMPSFLA